MGRVSTNLVSLAYSVEASLGVLAGSPSWKLLEPNNVTAFGATITKVARDPISPDRQRRKGVVVDLDSTVEFEHDLTREVVIDFLEAFSFASARYPYVTGTTRVGVQRSGASPYGENLSAVAATDDFQHDAIGGAYTAGRLVFSRGFTNSANNGMHEVDSGSTTTSTVTTSSLVDETPGNTANATMEPAGVRGATADLTWTDATKTLASTVLDFTTLGLTVGQTCHVGGLTSTNQFAGGVGYGRVSSIAANALIFDKFEGTLAADDAGTGKDIDLLYGAFIRNVTASDADFLERSFHFELALPDLDDTPLDEYMYAKGNYANQVTFNLPLTEKAVVEVGFVGTDTTNPSTSRETNAATPIEAEQTSAFGTASDVARLAVEELDEDALTTCFKSVSLTLNNQANPEKCLGTLGATYMNTGNYLVDLETQVLFTNGDVAAHIKNNETVTFGFIITNDDGALAVDVPSMTLGDGSLELPRDESVLINLAGEGYKDAVKGYTAAFSLIPAVP